MKQINFILLASLLLFSCRGNDKKADITRLVTEWQGREILFPGDITFTRYATDTADYRIPADAEYKVLVYVDSLGCTSCKLQLPKWKELIAHTDSITGGTVPFLFFFHPKNIKDIRHLLKQDGFDRPVCIDTEDRLNRLNRFPPDITFQTFLLDRNNRIVVLGNPVHKTAVKELYLKQITGKSAAPVKLTTAEAKPAEIDLGVFDQTEKRKATFTVRNTGDAPLVIADVTTSCGCTAATYDRHPAGPGETLRVEVEIHPEHAGFFEETITVTCNTDQAIILVIRGQTREREKGRLAQNSLKDVKASSPDCPPNKERMCMVAQRYKQSGI